MTATEWLTLVLVAITGFYAWATLRILKANEASVAAMRDQQEAEQRPYPLHQARHHACLLGSMQRRTVCGNGRWPLHERKLPLQRKRPAMPS